MPVGVPRVPYQHPDPEIEFASWLDLYNRLYRERILFLGQEINCNISNQLVSVLLYLNLKPEIKDIFFFINSPGGWVVPGFALFDAMQTNKSNVKTICFGLAASMGSFLLTGGAPTKRVAFPHARIMMHQPANSYYAGQTGEFSLESQELLKFREIIINVYVEKTRRSARIISKDIDRDIFMSSLEALFYGIVDLVGLDID
uniref:ATP-dependent Clp protease proteolytic subunit n=1 Tax=Sarcophyte sanguinea TaxID=1618143 RepID=UPI0026E3D090|nr:ATP-dependent Clp protease proteolytic subunit [Sarcophyte sanguinea]WJE89109.1 ATP-dependent Clp protease proteolytic subunit [Sarcophyte sanguinea]WJE89128.1 ATP-dependent Clp protease proteolytic subunit [Sarcophyte sanguinea]